MFVPPGSVAVLVTSLPGDVESENAYRDQVQTWLDILDDSGGANKIIAGELNISEETVKAHMRSILAKLSANDRTHAVMIALKRGIIEL